MRHRWFALVAIALVAESAVACTLCGGNFANRASLRQEALQARHVYYGTMSNPQISIGNAAGVANASTTDFTVDQVIKSDSAARKAQKKFTIPRYVPVDGKTPPKFLVFCSENEGKLDPYRGTPVTSAALVEYIRGATAIDAKDTAKVLAFAGKHLDSTDADVSAEAFLELAKADDADVLAAAKSMDPKKIRQMIDDPRTPSERLGLYAYLLGACGTPAEAEWIKGLLRQPGDRFRSATSGLYAGLIMIVPSEGWATVQAVLADGKRPFPERSAALNALRFYRNVNPTANRDRVLAGLKVLLPQDDIADLPIEDLRRWKMWDLSADVVGLYGRKGFDAPLMKRAILRYGLTCPDAVSQKFIAQVRQQQPELVKEVEEGLQFEKSP